MTINTNNINLYIRIYDNIAKHRIFSYAPYTNYSETIYQEFDLLYNRMKHHMDQYTFTMIDEDTILFKTEYDGMTFREEIRLIENNVRLRQTLGWKRNTVFLAGQYYEKRK